MSFLRVLVFALCTAAVAAAQDKVVLTNGDVFTGSIKSMTEGKLVLVSPLLGEMTIPFATIGNLTTEGPAEVHTTAGEHFRRRITGIENGRIVLEGDIPGVLLGNLAAINPRPEDQVKWTGSLTVNGQYVSGNTDRRTMGLAFEAIRRTEADRITTDAQWDYAEDKVAPGNWNLTQRRTGAGLKYDLFLTERMYALATTRVLGDTFADLDLRFTGGVGLGYQVKETDKTDLIVEAGLSYFYEDYRSATPSEDYLAARIAYKLRRELSETSRLVHGTEAFPSLERADDVYFQMRTEYVVDLAVGMIASLGWIWDYDNTPAPGAERSDHRVLLSVGWAF